MKRRFTGDGPMRNAFEIEQLSQQHILRKLVFALAAALALMSAVALTN
jgi:hypothetical protein